MCKTFLAVRFFFLRLEKDSRQRRTEGQRREATESHRTGDGDTKLREERTARSGHEGHGNKYSHEDQRTTDDSHRHFAHGIFRSLVCRSITALHLRHHRLDDDDCIIDDRTDRQHEGKERQDIQGESRYFHHCERT